MHSAIPKVCSFLPAKTLNCAACCSLLTGFWQDCLCTHLTLDLWPAMHVMACTQGVLTVLGITMSAFACLVAWVPCLLSGLRKLVAFALPHHIMVHPKQALLSCRLMHSRLHLCGVQLQHTHELISLCHVCGLQTMIAVITDACPAAVQVLASTAASTCTAAGQASVISAIIVYPYHQDRPSHAGPVQCICGGGQHVCKSCRQRQRGKP